MTERNYAISILRVAGMFSIVICHFTGWLGIAFLQQFFNFGVYLFLFISGFLYANKDITNYGRWFLSRLEKILIPYYLFAIPVIIIYYCFNSIDIFEILKYLFCLQGLNFVLNGVQFTEIAPLGNLWFITIILICYLLTIIVKKIEKNKKPRASVVTIILVAAFAVSSVLNYFSIPCISLGYFITYFIGYYISKFKVKNSIFSFSILGVCLFAVSIIFRLLGKAYLDESNQSAYLIIASVTHLGVAVSSYFFVAFLTEKVNLLGKLAKSKIWTALDKISYCIYITHYAFLHSITSVDNFGLSKPLTIVLFMVFTLVSALLIYWVNGIIQKRLHRIQNTY